MGRVGRVPLTAPAGNCWVGFDPPVQLPGSVVCSVHHLLPESLLPPVTKPSETGALVCVEASAVARTNRAHVLLL